MAEKLSAARIDRFLRTEVIGRLGCYADGKIYVVPINYGYDGKCIYAHSSDGAKIEMMRKNPEVCFEIDRWDRDGTWRSVILWGKFEELTTVRSQSAAMKVFINQMVSNIPSYKAMPSHGFVKGAKNVIDPFKAIVFCVRISEVTGRAGER